MHINDFLALGLNLTAPWRVVDQKLDVHKQPSELSLEVEAERGAKYPCPKCNELCKAHDFAEVTWRHLNFFQHHCLIKARVPRVHCPQHGIHRTHVPWARPTSGFTLLFEQMVLSLTRKMSVNAAAKYVGVTDKRIWRVVRHYMSQIPGQLDLKGLCGLDLDETTTKPGHRCVTIFVDMDRETRPLIFAIPGKGKDCLKQAATYFKKGRKGNSENVVEVACD